MASGDEIEDDEPPKRRRNLILASVLLALQIWYGVEILEPTALGVKISVERAIAIGPLLWAAYAYAVLRYAQGWSGGALQKVAANRMRQCLTWYSQPWAAEKAAEIKAPVHPIAQFENGRWMMVARAHPRSPTGEVRPDDTLRRDPTAYEMLRARLSTFAFLLFRQTLLVESLGPFAFALLPWAALLLRPTVPQLLGGPGMT